MENNIKGVILITYIALTVIIVACNISLKENIKEIKEEIKKSTKVDTYDYKIKLLPGNSIYLISKDTTRKIDFYDLEQEILEDNL